ncbi:hypothetical protein EF888_16235 [Silicimonas algicola]|uniref:Uncharacterized protein n=1 Tax=Silicimonas algicola TaxID=1826607 RepID=A0A316G470_9RHOB|nr:hypothetical protein [Silicimonas algicola]AZQ68543.1 hypothetical protein EF888_16235 [Silicimonas algicola]PWK55744.1 hypothetical protein C8D95_106140 [Silicimonas algicola]
MDILSPLFLLLFKTFVVVLPMTVGWLAFRRLMLSKSANSWIYAFACLLAAITAAGLAPWTLGLARASWVFFILAAFCPAIWIGVVLLCDVSRRQRYEADPLTDVVLTFTSRQRPAPLVLEDPDTPGTPVPVFRHSKPSLPSIFDKGPFRPARNPVTRTRMLMSIARDMRGNGSSDTRRPKLLPAPDTLELPFLSRG